MYDINRYFNLLIQFADCCVFILHVVRFSPRLCNEKKREKIRAWRELNTLPLDLQSNALPMSYRPAHDSARGNKYI